VFPRLTLNYGVRYEHYGVQHNNKPQLDSKLLLWSRLQHRGASANRRCADCKSEFHRPILGSAVGYGRAQESVCL
jgi:hypothetical protein